MNHGQQAAGRHKQKGGSMLSILCPLLEEKKKHEYGATDG